MILEILMALPEEVRFLKNIYFMFKYQTISFSLGLQH